MRSHFLHRARRWLTSVSTPCKAHSPFYHPTNQRAPRLAHFGSIRRTRSLHDPLVAKAVELAPQVAAGDAAASSHLGELSVLRELDSADGESSQSPSPLRPPAAMMRAPPPIACTAESPKPLVRALPAAMSSARRGSALAAPAVAAYVVRIRTGDGRGSGTDAAVSIKIMAREVPPVLCSSH